jgi:TPR repeat protein
MKNEVETLKSRLALLERNFNDFSPAQDPEFTLSKAVEVFCNPPSSADYVRAASLFHAAAVQESRIACGYIADCFFYGIGRSDDDSKARAWWSKGASLGDPYCQACVLMVDYMLDLEGMPPGEKARAIELLSECDRRHVSAQQKLSEILHDEKLLKYSLKRGHPAARLVSYVEENNVEELEVMARRGFEFALSGLVILLRDDILRLVRICQRVVTRGMSNTIALMTLFHAYAKGEHVAKDMRTAVRYLRLAATRSSKARNVSRIRVFFSPC